MEIAIILLTSILTGAFFVGFASIGFFLGMKYQEKKSNDTALHINDSNLEEYQKMLKWFAFNGGGGDVNEN